MLAMMESRVFKLKYERVLSCEVFEREVGSYTAHAERIDGKGMGENEEHKKTREENEQ